MLRLHTRHVIYISIGVAVLLLLYALKNTSYFIRVLGFTLSIFLFLLADNFFNLNFKKRHYFIFIFISATGILLSPLYFVSTSYDKLLHSVSPFLVSILIFFMIDKIDTKFSIKLFITVMIVIASLAVFEIGEFTLDKSFDLKLQGVYIRDYSGVEKLKLIMDRNDDTMIDLVLGTASSLFFALIKISIFNYKKYFPKKKLMFQFRTHNLIALTGQFSIASLTHGNLDFS